MKEQKVQDPPSFVTKGVKPCHKPAIWEWFILFIPPMVKFGMVYEIVLPTLQTQGFPNASAGRAGIDGRGILRQGHDRRMVLDGLPSSQVT